MKLLDCTLRDGGYYTNWTFNDDFVREFVKSLSMTGVDIIEMGYKSPLKGGKYRKCDDSFIGNIVGNDRTDLAFMIDAKDFINGEVDVKLLKDIVKPSSESPFNYCRLAITPQQIKEALLMIDLLDELGYKVIVNTMRVSLLEVPEIRKFCSSLSNTKVVALYFADSFGSLLPTRVKEIVGIFKETGKDIGIHTHDNLGLAFANSLCAVDNGVEYIDGTLTGMGRGVGNVRTEQLLMYYDYDYKHIIDFIENKMLPMKEKYNWGWSHNYMLTGLKEIHPTYCQRLQSLLISGSKVQSILNNIDDKDKTSFNESYVDHMELTHNKFLNKIEVAEESQLGLDFDGVIHKNSKGFHDGTIYDEPIDGALNSIKYLNETLGYDLVIYTCKANPERPLIDGKNGIELIWDWLEKYGVKDNIKDVTYIKPNAIVYIDDRAVNFVTWEETLQFLQSKGM
jgi:4-hydroxy 2-oxovalerate aldolase